MQSGLVIKVVLKVCWLHWNVIGMETTVGLESGRVVVIGYGNCKTAGCRKGTDSMQEG